jgi:hypothetical protein
MQLGPGSPPPPPGGDGRQHYLLNTDPQRRGPTRICPQSPAAIPVYPRLRGLTQYQLHQSITSCHCGAVMHKVMDELIG